jgi:hypothetical protein
MRKNATQPILTALGEKDSPYFAGAACLLSLLPILKDLEKRLVDLDDLFPETEEGIARLLKEDGAFFALSLKKTPLEESEWNQVIAASDDYAVVVGNLNALQNTLHEIPLPKKIASLKEKTILLSHLCQLSLGSFYEMPDPPEAFFRSANNALVAIRGAVVC